MASEADDNGTPKIKRKAYEKELERLQAKLCMLQDWVKEKGLRVIVIFEGRDAAGKGGTIKAITERVSPRVFRVVALPAPSDREKSQMYVQRYMQHFPAAGEIVIFDRSWYNRAGVEHVMGFCTRRAVRALPRSCAPQFEQYIIERRHPADQVLARGRQQGAGTAVPGAHRRSVAAVEAEPHRPAIAAAMVRLLAGARRMLEVTDTAHAPWYIVRSDNKRRARLNCLAHLLSLIPYDKVPRPKVAVPARATEHEYDDEAPLRGRRFVPERY